MRRISVFALFLLIGLVAARLPHALARSQHQFTTFDVPGSGTGPGQGTMVNGITADGSVAGWYIDTNNVNHGFVRSSNGTITKFDVPGSGTGAGQGTVALGMNDTGAITGRYDASNNAFYAYVRSRNGNITTFEAPGAGAGSFQGTAGGSINPAGEISGVYVDATLARHGYVRAANGNITEFDPPGDGTGAHQGVYTSTFYGLNPAGVVAAQYTDSSDAFHGFVRDRNGAITTFDAPGAGT
jgi:hypothetical protein